MSEGVAMPLEMVSRAPIPAGARKVPIPHPAALNQSSTSSAVRKGPIGTAGKTGGASTSTTTTPMSQHEKQEKEGFQPVMMTFKAFLETQDDSITDEEALTKYAEYKLEFKRQQLNQFFGLHREREWLMLKYHPRVSKEVREEHTKKVQKRLAIFNEMDEHALFNDLVLSVDNESKLVELMDTLVMKIDGATEQEIQEYFDDPVACTKSPLTSSIFLRSLDSSVTKAELNEVCTKFSGFLRICLSDPVPERNWSRKAWITFKRNEKVKEICFSLNNTPVKGSELGPVVNKDLSRRAWSVTSITNDKKVMKHDISMATKLITAMDKKHRLWEPKSKSDSNTAEEGKDDSKKEEKEEENKMEDIAIKNPLLSNIHDFLVDEISAEEEELLGSTSQKDENEVPRRLDYDQELARALDKLILYLRFVHSIDFYNRCEYSHEDDMPNKCGIFHVRTCHNSAEAITDAQVEKYNEETRQKFDKLLKNKVDLTEEEVQKLGYKSEADEIEKFVLANCQELAKEKWLCPLSGKKFKAPEFVRKHIFNKFQNEVDQVKAETAYFNAYLRDPNRPELAVQPAQPAVKAKKDDRKNVGAGGGEEPLPGPPRKRSVKERLGVMPGITTSAGIKVTQAVRDPRSIVDYSDIDLSFTDIF